jgi:hypothetical protein
LKTNLSMIRLSLNKETSCSTLRENSLKMMLG